MSPEIVVVKDFTGSALVRWMVGFTDRVAKITDRAGADAVAAGREAEYVVGFPLSDIFICPTNTRITEGQIVKWAEFQRRF